MKPQCASSLTIPAYSLIHALSPSRIRYKREPKDSCDNDEPHPLARSSLTPSTRHHRLGCPHPTTMSLKHSLSSLLRDLYRSLLITYLSVTRPVGSHRLSSFQPLHLRACSTFRTWTSIGLVLLGNSAQVQIFAGDPATGPAAITSANPSASISLSEAKKTAFNRNWDLLAARSDVDIAVAQKWVAREFSNPIVSFSTTKVNTDGSPASTRLGNSLWHRSYDTIAAIGQLFEIGGKRSSRKAAAAAGIRGAEARLADARRLLDLAVTKSYVAALQSAANVQILRESAASLRKEAQIAETRLQAGDISKSDRAQIDVTAERFELDAQAAEAAARNAKIEVEVLLGEKNPQGLWTAADSQEDILKQASIDKLDELTTPRPDLLAARADVEKADAQLRLQKSLRIPDPTVTVQYEHEPPDQANTIGLGVSFPLPLWNLNRGNISAARAAHEQAVLQADKVNAQIASEILENRVAYLAAVTKQDRYAREIQPRSAEIKKAVTFAYQRGGASLLDLLSAQRNDNDIRLALVQATSDAVVAGASLRSALNYPSTRSP